MSELDRKMAERVMGWTLAVSIGIWEGSLVESIDSFTPTTDISQAFEVVEKMREKDYTLSLYENPFFQNKKWVVNFISTKDINRSGEAFATTPAMAICLAAENAACK
uniref:Phage ABA sandwich domain-containing protein n=1 Tax=viral metagenome TaxID=1070528 RepID=A0A6H2A3L6_9ZZZZ